MKVSILVPIYGVEKYIRECAESLFEQTYEKIEYIFVDDCSGDNSISILMEVMQQYPSRQTNTKIIRHDYNRGLAAARNTGVDNCTGTYLMHVDGDDFLERDAVKILVNKIQQYDNPDILIFGSNTLRNGRLVPSKVHSLKNKMEYIKLVLFKTVAPSIWGKIYRTDFYQKSSIRSIEGLNYSEDLSVVPRLLYQAKTVEYLNDCFLYNYRITPNSYTNKLKAVYVDNSLQTDELLYNYFIDKGIPYISEEFLNLMKLRTKAGLAKQMYLARSQYLFEKISGIYGELDCYVDKLSVIDRRIVALLDRKRYAALNVLLYLWAHGIKFRSMFLN